MAFRRRFGRRRGGGGKWLETALNTGIVADTSTSSGGIVFTPILRGNAPFSPGGNLAGQVLSAYQTFLHRRTVGDFFYVLTPSVQTTVPKIYTIHAGVAVMDVDETGAPLNGNQWAPASNDNTDMPWLWMRRWSLFLPAGSAVGDSITNVFQGLPLGPWVDIKVRRAIKRQQDLFLVDQVFENQFAAGVWGATITPTQLSAARGVHVRSYLTPVLNRW